MKQNLIDSGRMERLCEKYKDAPCCLCANSIVLDDLSDLRCNCFVDGIIPEEIVSGRNNHTSIIQGQIDSKVFTENVF